MSSRIYHFLYGIEWIIYIYIYKCYDYCTIIVRLLYQN
jgi:hypothetical protein